LQVAFEASWILDDAVVDPGDEIIAADMGMSVAVVGRPVGGPARVTDAVAPRAGPLAQVACQIGNATRLLADVQMRPGQRGYTGTVITAILQAAQSFNQDRFRFTRADITDNSTHGVLLYRNLDSQANRRLLNLAYSR